MWITLLENAGLLTSLRAACECHSLTTDDSAMATMMMMQASSTVARPGVVSLVSSFKGLSLESSITFCPSQVQPACRRLVVQPLTTAGYKLKTHKASAKRFSVTGSGKITRRSAGRAHLLRKKTTTRKNRLSGKTEVDHCDWQNVIGALPYLRTKK